MRILIILLLAGLLTGSAWGKTVAGVDLNDRVSVAGQSLVLNGAGIREKFFFDIYVVALYLPNKAQDAHKILGADQPWRVIMHFLYSEVDREKLDKGWDEGFEDNAGSKMNQLRERLQKFKGMFRDLHKGDEVVLDYEPGKGVTVRINGKREGVVQGADFARVLLSVWIGEEPVTKAVKRDLLG